MTATSPLTRPFRYATYTDTMSRIVGRMMRRVQRFWSGYTRSTAFPGALRMTASGSIPIAVPWPEMNPKPITDCQMEVRDFFALQGQVQNLLIAAQDRFKR